MATSCGSPVILTRNAMTVPMAPPMAMPPKTMMKVAICGSSKVAPMAMAMPRMPMILPVRAVSGEDRPRNARMKQIAETR